MSSSDVDKGWAWLIVVSTFIMCALTMGLPWAASGAYNAIFLKAFPESSAATVAWATSLTSAVSYLVGPVGSILVSRYGLRFPALIGGILAGSGFIISYFAPNIHFLIFSFGVLTGVGLGIGHISGNSAIAHYFDKHLGLATGLALSGSGVGTFIFAPLITTMDDKFGWRGSLLIVGGVTLNMCVCGVINRTNSRIKMRNSGQSFLDLSVFRIFGYRLLAVNSVCVAFGICIIYVHLMAFAESCGFSPTESSMLMSSIGFANLVSRFALPAATKLACVNTRLLFSVCYVLTGVTACMYPLVGHSYIALLTLSVGFGFFTASYGALMTILVVETVGVNRFAYGYGYLLLFMGLGHMCGGPTAGVLFDITKNYHASLYIGGGMIILGGIIPLFAPCGDVSSRQEVETKVEEKTQLPTSSLIISEKTGYVDEHVIGTEMI